MCDEDELNRGEKFGILSCFHVTLTARIYRPFLAWKNVRADYLSIIIDRYEVKRNRKRYEFPVCLTRAALDIASKVSLFDLASPKTVLVNIFEKIPENVSMS
jgi:hypothetical protein